MTDNEERPKVDAEKVLSIVSQSLWSQKLYNEAVRDLVMFGTTHPYIYKKPTLWWRFKYRMRTYKDRIRDAWLVLIGKAEIYEGQDD